MFDTVVDRARLERAMTATADAIREKTGGTGALLWSPETGFRAAVGDIAVGTPPVREKDVNFYDYDGTLLHSYTMEEARALTALPQLPERNGLICQGWTWSLDEVKTVDRPTLVAANYDTPDGAAKLRIHTVIDGLTVSLNFYQAVANDIAVDWGDGSPVETYGSGGKFSLPHTYSLGGEYTISLSAKSGSFEFGDFSQAICSQDVVREVNLGSQVFVVNAYAFNGLRTLEKVSFSQDIAFSGMSIFQNGGALRFLALPKNAAAAAGAYFCRWPGALFGVSAPKYFSFGVAAFCDAYNLRFAAIPDGQASVGSTQFRAARAMSRVDFPASVTTIAANAFANCSAVMVYDFTRHTSVPTLEATSAFTGMNGDCEIRVPAALYAEWCAATNWVTYAANMVGV